jgi:hypothetical protein
MREETKDFFKALSVLITVALLYLTALNAKMLERISSRLDALERAPQGMIARVHPQDVLSSARENQIIDKLNELDKRCPKEKP